MIKSVTITVTSIVFSSSDMHVKETSRLVDSLSNQAHMASASLSLRRFQINVFQIT